MTIWGRVTASWCASLNEQKVKQVNIIKMERSEIEAKVRKFMIEDLEIDEEKITPDAHLMKDMGIDSLDFIDIVVIVEKTFGVKIKSEEMAGVDTFSKFCDYLETKIG